MLLMSGDGGGWECGGCDSEEVGNGSSWQWRLRGKAVSGSR